MKERLKHFFNTQADATECFVAGDFIFFKESDAAAHDKKVKKYTRDTYEGEFPEDEKAGEGENENIVAIKKLTVEGLKKYAEENSITISAEATTKAKIQAEVIEAVRAAEAASTNQ